MKTILGIDNGLGGALSFYNEKELIIYDMPVFEVDGRKKLNISEIKRIILNDRPQACFVEQLTPMPKIGGLQSFSMGHSEGVFLGLFSALEIPYTLIRPKKWKKAMQCPADKDGSRMRASQLLPQFAHNWPLKRHDGRAESALIALYGYQNA